MDINYDIFKKEIEEIKDSLENIDKKKIINHYKKIKLWSDSFYWLGIFILCLSPFTIFPWLFLSLGIFSKWAIMGHHICHGGFDNYKGLNCNRKTYGVKTLYRRSKDWFDWWLVEAWNIEHNNLHHYYLGEINDPDLVEHNFELRKIKLPFWIKKILIFFVAFIWKWFYYAPNTYKYYCLHKLRINDKKKYDMLSDKEITEPYTILGYLTHNKKWLNGFYLTVILPYFIYMFGIIPMIWYIINNYMEWNIMNNVFINLILAELLTNLHSFIVIVTNHCGEDLYRFENHVMPKSGEFYLRQIISSTNFNTGGDINDFLHGWLNYQIEHHIFPDLSMYEYKIIQPKIKNLCKKYKIPYIQENVFIRLKKTVDIMTGQKSMKWF